MEAGYIRASSITAGANCTVNRTGNTWYTYGITITWTATAGYTFTSGSSSSTLTRSLTTPGGSYNEAAHYYRVYPIAISVDTDTIDRYTIEAESYTFNPDQAQNIEIFTMRYLSGRTPEPHVFYKTSSTAFWTEIPRTEVSSTVLSFTLSIPANQTGAYTVVANTEESSSSVCDSSCTTYNDSLVCFICSTSTDSSCTTVIEEGEVCTIDCSTDANAVINCGKLCSSLTSGGVSCNSCSTFISGTTCNSTCTTDSNTYVCTTCSGRWR